MMRLSIGKAVRAGSHALRRRLHYLVTLLSLWREILSVCTMLGCLCSGYAINKNEAVPDAKAAGWNIHGARPQKT